MLMAASSVNAAPKFYEREIFVRPYGKMYNATILIHEDCNKKESSRSQRFIIKSAGLKKTVKFKVNGKTQTFKIVSKRTDSKKGQRNITHKKADRGLCRIDQSYTAGHVERLVFSIPQIPGYGVVVKTNGVVGKAKEKESTKTIKEAPIKAESVKERTCYFGTPTIKKSGNNKKFTITYTVPIKRAEKRIAESVKRRGDEIYGEKTTKTKICEWTETVTVKATYNKAR